MSRPGPESKCRLLVSSSGHVASRVRGFKDILSPFSLLGKGYRSGPNSLA